LILPFLEISLMEVNLKTIGLIDGMSWESTMAYYQMINEVIKEELGGLHSAKILLLYVQILCIRLSLICKQRFIFPYYI